MIILDPLGYSEIAKLKTEGASNESLIGQEGRCSDRGEVRAREPGLGRLRVGAAERQSASSWVLGSEWKRYPLDT